MSSRIWIHSTFWVCFNWLLTGHQRPSHEHTHTLPHTPFTLKHLMWPKTNMLICSEVSKLCSAWKKTVKQESTLTRAQVVHVCVCVFEVFLAGWRSCSLGSRRLQHTEREESAVSRWSFAAPVSLFCWRFKASFDSARVYLENTVSKIIYSHHCIYQDVFSCIDTLWIQPAQCFFLIQVHSVTCSFLCLEGSSAYLAAGTWDTTLVSTQQMNTLMCLGSGCVRGVAQVEGLVV